MSTKSTHHDHEVIFFKDQASMRKWLEKIHQHEKELFVGYYKKSTGIASISWSESVDQALCVGWIDGIRRSIDAERYYIRFTPRKPSSIWSQINLKKMEELIKNNQVTPEGMQVFLHRDLRKTNIYSFEQSKVPTLKVTYLKKFKSNRPAYTWFAKAAPSYQRTAIHWVMSARQEVTQLKRLKELIDDSAAGIRIKSLRG